MTAECKKKEEGTYYSPPLACNWVKAMDHIGTSVTILLLCHGNGENY